MSKQNKIARLESGPSPRKKPRGRTADVSPGTTPHSGDIADKAHAKLEKMVDVNRGTGKPSKRGGKNRGDRRDMSPTYTGNARHASRGNTPRVDVSTRAR
jgi:hypothetical protein